MAKFRSSFLNKKYQLLEKIIRTRASFLHDTRRVELDEMASGEQELNLGALSGAVSNLAFWYHNEALLAGLNDEYSIARSKFEQSASLLLFVLPLERFAKRPNGIVAISDVFPLFISHLICIGLDKYAAQILTEGLLARAQALPFPCLHPGGRGPRFLPLQLELWKHWSEARFEITNQVEPPSANFELIRVPQCYLNLLDSCFDANEAAIRADLIDAQSLHIAESRESTDRVTYDFDSPSFSLYPAELYLALELRRRSGFRMPLDLPELLTSMNFEQLRGATMKPDPAVYELNRRLIGKHPSFPDLFSTQTIL